MKLSRLEARKLLRREYYLLFGELHRDLREQVEIPGKVGADLAYEIVKLLAPNEARALMQNYLSPEEAFRAWLKEHDGEEPEGKQTSGQAQSKLVSGGMTSPRDFGGHVTSSAGVSQSRSMDQPSPPRDGGGDLWIGVGIVFGLLTAGTIAALYRRVKARESPVRSHWTQPASQPPAQVCRYVACATYPADVRDAVDALEKAPSVLTAAAYWWWGEPESWEQVVKLLGLRPVQELSGADAASVVVLYELRMDSASLLGQQPTRMDAADYLSRAARTGQMHEVRLYSVAEPAQFTAAGFRR